MARENARIDVGKLRNAQPIEYQYAPGLKARPGGPDSRGHSLLAVGETVDRKISKEVVDCDTGEHRTVRCSDPLRGSLIAYATGAYALWTTRSRSIVNMTILLMGMDFQRLLTCDDDPGIVIGSSFLEAATHDTYLVRTTVPLRAFTRPTTTITLSRTLPAPADAASRGYPTGTLTVQAKLVLRKVIRNHISCPAKDPLFVCDNR